MSNNQIIETQILEKYTVVKKLGSGAYGHVWKVIENSTKKIFALKKIFQAFQHATDAQRTYRQISILKKVQNTNIVGLHEVYLGKNLRDVYLLFDFMDTDLYHAVYEQILQPVHKKYVLYQLLLGTLYLHRCGLIHRDLKPSNILLNSQCKAKICDFGLARMLEADGEEGSIMTQGVATRWYRAPEVLLGSCTYGQKADIWSIGCIMAQIVMKNPFFPGSSTINQLQKILQFTGIPSQEDIHSIKCEYAQKFIQQCSHQKTKTGKEMFGASFTQQKILIDLIYKILVFNPQKRLNTEQILRHQYFKEFFNQSDITKMNVSSIRLEIIDSKKLSTQEYRNIISTYFTISSKATVSNLQQSKLSRVSAGKDKTLLEKDKSSARKSSNLSKSKLTISPSHSPQRFRDIKTIRENSFGKLLGSDKVKKRSDSRDSNMTELKEKKSLKLFSELIKNKDSQRKQWGSKSRSKSKPDKQNIHTNNIKQKNNDSLKKFQQVSKQTKASYPTTSRVSFQGLKKTGHQVKFKR